MGFLRFILAAFVVFQHISRISAIGAHSVVFFFVISGYLMTLVMHGSYGYDRAGFARFWMNRILRLYPAYLVLLVVGVVLLWVVPPSALVGLSGALGVPANPWHWLQNLTMLYLAFEPYQIEPRIAPATWALTIELVYYLLISLGLSRSRRITLIWFGVSSVYTLLALAMPNAKDLTYHAITAGSLPFSVGALIYHYRDTLARYLRWSSALSFAGLMLALLGIVAFRLACRALFGANLVDSLSVIATVPVAAAMTLLLMQRKWTPLPRKWDTLLGDLSYPIYISHWTCALALTASLGMTGYATGPVSLAMTAMTLVLAMLFGLFVVTIIDPRVEALRTRIRNRRPVTAEDRAKGAAGAPLQSLH